jgi:hypothetical protein
MKTHLTVLVIFCTALAAAVFGATTATLYKATITQQVIIDQHKQDNAILIEISEALIQYTTKVRRRVQPTALPISNRKALICSKKLKMHFIVLTLLYLLTTNNPSSAGSIKTTQL